MVTYLVVNGISRAFRPAGLGEATPGVQARQAAGKAGCALFLYLEVLDAAFSFDGVTGAFAITTDPIIIALGLGVVGAMFVRSITIYLVRQDTLDRYVYLEHGAHWAIGALAIILLLSIDHRFAVPEWVTASVGGGFYRGGVHRECAAQSPNSQVPHEVRIMTGGGCQGAGGRPKPKSVCTGLEALH